MSYLISVGGCGDLARHEEPNWFLTIAVVRAYAARHPGAEIQVQNMGRADFDTNGLTDEEEEQLEDAIHCGRVARRIDERRAELEKLLCPDCSWLLPNHAQACSKGTP